MVIGDKNRFAVEYELNEQYFGRWMYGTFCYWIRGEHVGDKYSTILPDIIGDIDAILYNNGKRSCKTLFTAEASDFINLVENVTSDDCSYNDLLFRLKIKPHVDVFDYWKVYLVEYDCQSRILYYRDNKQDIKEIIIDSSLFAEIIRQLASDLNDLYRKVTSEEYIKAQELLGSTETTLTNEEARYITFEKDRLFPKNRDQWDEVEIVECLSSLSELSDLLGNQDVYIIWSNRSWPIDKSSINVILKATPKLSELNNLFQLFSPSAGFLVDIYDMNSIIIRWVPVGPRIVSH